MRRVARATLALLLGAAAPALAQDAGFTFAGFGLKSDAATVTTRYPRSLAARSGGAAAALLRHP